MESYIVRIYRRDRNSAHNLVGLVELVEVEKEKAFRNFDELRAILEGKQMHSVHKELKSSEEDYE